MKFGVFRVLLRETSCPKFTEVLKTDIHIMVDQQLMHNDCGISVVKTVFNLHGRAISRQYIKDHIRLDDKGSSIGDIKAFFEENGFLTEYNLMDIHHVEGHSDFFEDLFPFITPINRQQGLHFIVVNGIKKNKLKIYDPAEAKSSLISIQELKRVAYFSRSYLKYVDMEARLRALILEELEPYAVDTKQLLNVFDLASLFNKVSYFSWFRETYGFINAEKEMAFLNDLLFNLDVSALPKQFRTLKVSSDQIQIKAPLMLSIKPDPEAVTSQEEEEEQKNLYSTLFHQLGKHKKIWYIYLFAALFAASITQLAVFINQVLIDHVLPSFQLNILVLFAIGVGIFKVFELLIAQYKYFISIHLGNILDRFFLNNFDQKLNDYPIQYIHTFNRGDLSERLSDAMKLKAFFLRFFTRILVDSFVALYSLLLLFLISWKLTLVVCVVMVLFYAWFKIITPYLKTFEQKRFIRKADFFSKMLEKIEGLQVIKSFGVETSFSNTISKRVDRLIDIQTRVRYFNLLNAVVVSLIITIAYVLIVVFLAKDAIEAQTISIGQIITFIALSVNIFRSLGKILEENLTLQEHEVILRRYFDFNTSLKTKSVNKGIESFAIEKLSLKDIQFTYANERPLLSGINMDIRKGDKIRIEGGNGSGKSTLGKVLSQLYEQHSGDLLVNDLKSNFYHSKILRQKILLVSSEDILFNETLAFNIGLGKKRAVRQILNLAKQIGFYDFIAGHEEGLDYQVSENGRNLSTGQRKKILLLRALTSDAEIIILDEVLSGIDQASRLQAEALLNSLDKIVILISHEPVHQVEFNKQYLLQDGQLIS